MPDITATDPAAAAAAGRSSGAIVRRRTIGGGSRSTIAQLGPDGEPQLSYEDVDTSLIPPRPRLYGVTGGQMIEEVWRRAAETGVAQGPFDLDHDGSP